MKEGKERGAKEKRCWRREKKRRGVGRVEYWKRRVLEGSDVGKKEECWKERILEKEEC